MKLAVGVAVLLLLPSAAFAQGNPGPFGGLFGRTPERIGRDYTIFEIRTSTGLQFDDQTLNLGGVADQDRGRIAGLTGAALFDHNSTRLQTKLRSRVSYHQFLQTQVGATTVENSGAVTWRVGTRLSVDASGSYIYSPYLQFFPNLVTPPYTPSVVPPSLPYTTGLVESDTAEATVGFTSHYSKQSTFSAMVSRRQTQFRAVDDADYESNSGRVLWTRRTGRNLGVRLGYSHDRTKSAVAGDADYLNESIEAGLDFSRPLSLTRHTTLAIETQSSIISLNGGRHFRFNGGVVLGHRVARTWRLTATARRMSEFLAEFRQPLFSDMVGASLAGMLASRAELFLSADGGRGHFGVEGEHGRFRMAAATAQLNIALTRKLGLFAQYGAFYYEYPPGVTTFSTPYRMSRQALTFGANTWLPIITRERTPSDSR